jgi:acyl-coenzyme A thioesterase PaaI-like protein
VLVPPYIITEAGGDGAIRGHVTYDRFYLGGNSAVHGGANALLFDDLLGKLVNHRQERMARTASLTVSYRQVTPLNAELGVEAHIDRIDGRKRTTSGRLVTKAGVVLAEAKGLFVELQDGQP